MLIGEAQAYAGHKVMLAKTFKILSFVLLVSYGQICVSTPIQVITGVISEIEEGFLWLQPDDQSPPRKFLLRWKARFTPPKLPLKGDHVQILYKDKQEGAVIYGLNYLKKGANIPNLEAD